MYKMTVPKSDLSCGLQIQVPNSLPLLLTTPVNGTTCLAAQAENLETFLPLSLPFTI